MYIHISDIILEHLVILSKFIFEKYIDINTLDISLKELIYE